ncbi:DUF6985 domain-containing protein [Marinicella sediminis]|uniref:DUF6985 domain-containing protein n=1 Tax=Marinicella sediminis TaxID=1792834 RepID=A0ABV7J5J1_9GAMM|nr:hypothetical protein [Marinicella sediminis]
MNNKNAPTYPDTSSDEFFIYTTIKSPGFDGLNVRNGPYGALSSKAPSDGTVVFCADKGLDCSIFLAESKWVSDHSCEIIQFALEAMVDQYWENRENVLECLIDENSDEVVPEITIPSDLKSLCGIVSIHIKEPGELGKHRFGIEFGCNWEDEHGAGVRFENLKVINDGQASASFDY